MARILIVEDSAVARAITGDVLRRVGHTILEADDGIKGVERYQRERPDAVLMDVTMPRIDGLSALIAIRRFDPTARVTMLTAQAQMKTALAAMQIGARDFVVKPFEDSRLLLAVERMLEPPPPKDALQEGG